MEDWILGLEGVGLALRLTLRRDEPYHSFDRRQPHRPLAIAAKLI